MAISYQRKLGDGTIVIDSNTSKVGIGTNDPDKKLHVKSSANEGIFMEGTGGGHWFNFKSSVSNLWSMGAQSGLMGWYNRTDSSYKMVIKDNGNVGMGTTNPQNLLHVYAGSIDTRAFNESVPTNVLYFNPTNGNSAGDSNTVGTGVVWKTYYQNYTKRSAGIMQIGEGNYFRSGLAFYTNDTSDTSTDWSERMRLSMEGYLGIGTASPTTKLYVDGGESTFNRGNSDGAIARFRGKNAEKAVIGTLESWFSGKLGIGTTSPDEKLSVIGNTGLYGSVSGGIVSPASLKFFTSENGAGLGDSSGSNKQNIGQITWAGKDTSSNAAGEYAAIRTYLIDSNNLIQGSQSEGGQIEFSILRHDVSAQSRVEYTALTINNSANVGIGTTNPAQKLHINDGGIRVEKLATGLGGFISVGNGTEVAGNYSAYFFGNTNQDSAYFKGGIAYETLSSTNGRGDMHFLQNSEANGNNATISNSVMTILNGGNVGIGTTSPTGKLHVYGGRLVLDNVAAAQTAIQFNSAGSEKIVVYRPTSTDDFRIYTPAAGDAFTLLQSGNVGIGTTSPSYKLDVNGSFSGGGLIADSNSFTLTFSGADVLYGSLSSGAIPAKATFGVSDSGIVSDYPSSEALRINSSGNIGIGTTNPQAKLHVNGTVRFQSLTSGLLQADSNGDLTTTSATALTQSGIYSPKGWKLTASTYTGGGQNITSSSTASHSGTTPVTRTNNTTFTINETGYYEIRYQFVAKNNYADRCVVGAQVTDSGNNTFLGSRSFEYLRYTTYGEYATIQATFYATIDSGATVFLKSAIRSGSLNYTLDSETGANAGHISFRLIKEI